MTPSRDMAMFSGDRKPGGGSRDRSRSPNVVCTRTGPSEKKTRTVTCAYRW